MNSESKFSAQMLRGLKNPEAMEEQPATESEQQEQETSAIESKQPKGGKVGKSRDPRYKRQMILVQKDTEKTAARKWEDEQPEMDFSDLVERLLRAYADGRISV